ncbi:MAG: PAS domain S-box protein [Myxococcales bacterium]|nr:MAG: PAS domain S-box protein [Myxococcales bacterium]
MSDTPELRPEMEETRPLNMAIVGGGRACESFLNMIRLGRLGRFAFEVCGVADVQLDSPGIRYAREIGIPKITTDFRELLTIPDLDLIVELTGNDRVRDELERLRPRHVRLVDSFGASLFWALYTAEEARIQQRNEMRERVEAEREWIYQVFDNIPDEIMVMDPDGVVQHANAKLLEVNGLTIDQVSGKFCYDLELVRGGCRIDVENCPFDEVRRTKTNHSMVRQYFDRQGKSHYAAVLAGPVLDKQGDVIGIIESTRDITNRIRLEAQLKATETRLRQFMDLAPVAASVKNPQGQYIDVNQAACLLLSRQRHEILGKTDLEICDREAAAVFRAGDQRVLQTGERYYMTEKVKLGGKTVYLSTIKFPILNEEGEADAVYTLSTDVTELRKAERERDDVRDYLENIVNNSPVIILSSDPEGRIVSFNRGAEEALGYKFFEVVGRSARELYQSPEERDMLLRRVANEGAVRDYETTLATKSGAKLPVSITLSPLKDSEGNVIGTVGMAKDISRRKALMSQVLQSERQAAVGRLASGVAHEINNPLAVISEIAGYLNDLVSDDPEIKQAATQKELVDSLPKILREVKRCRGITARLLSFARKTEATQDVADVKSAIEEILPFWEKQARLTQVTIHRDYAETLPRVRVEELQLQEIFINIINNALQAIGEQRHGGNIWIAARQNSGKVVVSIKDDGPGIPQEIMDKIFDPFVTTKPIGQGTGLGLSICYGIVKRYDGEITVQSRPGEGATFNVILPIADAARSSLAG